MVRKIKNKKTHKQTQKDYKEKLGLFDKLPEECLACLEPFDRQNKEQVTTWNVVVRNEKEEVRLYCPECWSKAQQVVKDFEQRIKEREQA
jgi:Zn finger protein HypA/HybF involved in hydrogenase expression